MLRKTSQDTIRRGGSNMKAYNLIIKRNSNGIMLITLYKGSLIELDFICTNEIDIRSAFDTINLYNYNIY